MLRRRGSLLTMLRVALTRWSARDMQMVGTDRMLYSTAPVGSSV